VGNPITIEAKGKDEKKAVTQIVALFNAKFNEGS
jgi:phosphotransferase system HPr-like phosphotransfer protein